MSTPVQTRTGSFVWHDHGSPDPATATKFYGDLFGWKLETFRPEDMNYQMIKVNGQLHGGFGSPPGNPPPHWTGNVLVDDADKTVERAKKAGGSVLAEPMDIPDVGRFALIGDPQGASVAVIATTGDAPSSEGTFAWDELVTTDVDDAERFYGEVFGWTFEPQQIGEHIYTVIKRTGDISVGGLMERPEETIPPMWTTYIGTTDADETIARAKELGAEILNGPMDVPGQGRFAIIKDPTAAVFGIWQQTS